MLDRCTIEWIFNDVVMWVLLPPVHHLVNMFNRSTIWSICNRVVMWILIQPVHHLVNIFNRCTNWWMCNRVVMWILVELLHHLVNMVHSTPSRLVWEEKNKCIAALPTGISGPEITHFCIHPLNTQSVTVVMIRWFL